MSGALSRLAQTVAPAARAQTAVSPALAGLGSFKAYHASPRPSHFDRFDFSPNMGKGEGNQAYGHGGYFAGDEGVAIEGYRIPLSFRKIKNDFGNAGLADDADYSEVLSSIVAFDPRQQEFLRRLHENDWLGFDYPSQAISEALKQGLPRRYEVSDDLLKARSSLGTAYEVEVSAPERSLLDWDATLGQQPKAIQDEYLPLHPPTREAFGERAWREMVDKIAGGDESQAALRAASSKAAEEFRQMGVPGVRYLDGQSRRAGQGTRNYVMFPGTEDMIKILRKYSILAPLAGAAASQGD